MTETDRYSEEFDVVNGSFAALRGGDRWPTSVELGTITGSNINLYPFPNDEEFDVVNRSFASLRGGDRWPTRAEIETNFARQDKIPVPALPKTQEVFNQRLAR